MNHGIIHYLIDPGKPAQNGKVERSHRTDRAEFWNKVSFHSLEELQQKTVHVRGLVQHPERTPGHWRKDTNGVTGKCQT